jgi:NADH-quinone oxidoreductase subunit J
MMEIAFYLAAAIAIYATVRVITNTNPVHALLSLIVSLLAVAMIFFMLGAPFAGALEVIVYAGAIMVLFVFVVMMLNMGSHGYCPRKTMDAAKIMARPECFSCRVDGSK